MYHRALCALVFMMVHLLGFGGSALIVLAVTMRSVVWLRSFGLIGSATFVAYGIALGAWPIVITNVVTTSIHLFHLRTLANTDARGVIRTPLSQRSV